MARDLKAILVMIFRAPEELVTFPGNPVVPIQPCTGHE